MRYLTPYLQKDLLTKPVLLAGPRQCGKTTLAKALTEQSTYLNWDIRKDKLTIKNRDWPQKTALLILNELHKMQKWKNYLKDIIDSQSYGKSLLVTYFFDCAAAYEDKTAGARLENLVASCILKQCHLETDTTGVKTELHYFRDRDNHEVDFVITRGRKIWACIEVKQSDNQISLGMKYAVKKLNPIHALQLVQNLAKINSKEVEYESQGIQVCSLARRLDSLSEIFASSV